MGILDVVLHAALGVGGICTGVKHGKALFDGVKNDLTKKQSEKEDQEKQTEE